MRQLQDRTAVITGAASGFGLELARLAARAGMSVVLSDIEAEPLARAEAEIQTIGATTLAMRIDVSRAEEVQALAEATFSRFGVPELLINNAGISAGGLAWENTPNEWHQVMGVNLHGVVNGVRSFVPHMLEAAKQSDDFEAHIVNVASMAGLQCAPLMSLYNSSKFAVLGFTETLYHDLALLTDRVNVSVVCPGMVPTDISRSERHAPVTTLAPTASQQLVRMMTDQGMALSRVSAVDVAQQTMAAVMESRFYVFTHPQDIHNVSVRAADQLAGRNPTDPFEQLPGVTAYLKKSLNAG
jgi:NAD(P)-dependent dehydrogenase (short-subunit alcohol dehydrogenase family)